MRMPRPTTSDPVRSPAAVLPRRRWATLIALGGLGVFVAALVAVLLLGPGPGVSIGHGAAPERLGWAAPSPTLGAMVTMVGPLGVTFPCWAASHFVQADRRRFARDRT